MDRRKFIKTGISAGIVAGSAFSFWNFNRLMAGNNFYGDFPFDLVATRGGEPGEMFDRAIASLGGMKNFVSEGNTVVVKPNIGWDVPPERAGNTNPDLIRSIVTHCFNAGAKEVYVFDNTCDKWNKCYENSGIQSATKDAGGKVVPGHAESYYHPVEVPNGKRLKNAKVHELILESDVFINVPVLKHHGSADLSIAMKNLMGIVWDRPYWHKNDLHQCIADFVGYRKPDLNVVDAYRIMMKNGPRGVSVDDVVMQKMQVVSPDIVAADAAAAKIFGTEPEDVEHIKIADEMGLGTMNLEQLNINRIKIEG